MRDRFSSFEKWIILFSPKNADQNCLTLPAKLPSGFIVGRISSPIIIIKQKIFRNYLWYQCLARERVDRIPKSARNVKTRWNDCWMTHACMQSTILERVGRAFLLNKMFYDSFVMEKWSLFLRERVNTVALFLEWNVSRYVTYIYMYAVIWLVYSPRAHARRLNSHWTVLKAPIHLPIEELGLSSLATGSYLLRAIVFLCGTRLR